MMKLSTFLLLVLTLVAFAANSILCRLALMSGSIGPIEFTMIRLGSGMFILLPLIIFRKRLLGSVINKSSDGFSLFQLKLSNCWQAIALFGYAIFFSLAYVQIDVGVGALILFPTVQITMMGISIVQGNKVTMYEWIGFALSLAGLVYLLSPSMSAPPLIGTMMMIVSGISWGVYSLLGKGESQPILSTARNFLFCLPGVVILSFLTIWNYSKDAQIEMNSYGVLLAVLSGAIASGVGYLLWYVTLRRVTMTTASVSQLVVPVIAAIGGIIFLDESLSLRMVIASGLILGGIAVTIFARK